MLMEITGGIGKGGENKHLSIDLAVAISGVLTNLGFDDRLKFGELAVAHGRDGLGFL